VGIVAQCPRAVTSDEHCNNPSTSIFTFNKIFVDSSTQALHIGGMYQELGAIFFK
jgi:hypothetical protein